MSIERQLIKARSLARSGAVGRARDALTAILNDHPANRRAQQALAQLDAEAPGNPPAADMARIAALSAEGRPAEAFALAGGLARRFAKSSPLWTVLGYLALKLEDGDVAQSCFMTALSLNERAADPMIGVGLVHHRRGRLQEAIACLELALDRQPDHAQGRRKLAALYAGIECHDVALTHFRRALVLSSDDPQLHEDCAITLMKLHRFDEATEALAPVLTRWPGRFEAPFLAGLMCAAALDLPKALSWFERADRLRPDDQVVLSMMKARSQMADWSEWPRQADLVARLGQGTPDLNPGPIISLTDDPAIQRWHAERASRHQLPAAGAPVPARAAEPGDRLRIGYFSADFHDHATMVLMAGLFEHHDRSRFEVFAYSYGREDDSPTRRRLVAAVEHFCDIRKMTDADIAARARMDGIDIAIDLKGFTLGSRLAIFSHRAAPIQMSWLGWPGTLGNAAFDYAIVDRVTVPEQFRAGFSESLIRMPDSYQVNDDARPVPAPARPRAEYGLPEDGFVFCCFNATYKISPREFDIWMRLLSQVEGSVLWLLGTTVCAEANLRAEAERRGVDAARLIFARRAPLAQHLRRQGAADLFLDTFVYNAHTTCSDALWAGLPVVTLPGRHFAARVGASLLSAVGLPELIAPDEAAYERLALELARAPDRLAAMRAGLIANRRTLALFDTARFTRNLETAFEMSIARHRAGQEPGDIDVPASAIRASDCG
ncbi:tetratricopeptide repeat protein [Paracoccus hibiscisoli]|uniref:protein O-GlcNAc transferase n=1 Tax=Paracoccus hibiscisoli TaxID=2023261 RepID=A0A4U0QN26_9RHOB|nr:glycosyltransferase family 41 protein [Paracoccus hibiscisoli]TJZ82890.1 tetratricopeptide repeat protein [Paracoccus hibiscisoli]